MRNPQCKLCNRCELAKTVCMYGKGNGIENKSIMVVIDTISKAQDQTGLFLQGQGGTALYKLLNESHILNNCYITAAVKCHNAKDTKDKILAKHIKACRKYLLDEIDEKKPKLIICLGAVSANAVFGKHYPLKNMRQRFFQFGQSQVAVTYSHNVIFTDPTKYASVSKDLQWIINNFNKSEDELDYTLKVNEPITEGKIYGIDVETRGLEGTGLNPYVGKLLTVAIANPITKESVGYNISHDGHQNINESK